MNINNQQEKRALKQFILSEKEDYIIYLQNIIIMAVKCLERHKGYLQELQFIMEKNRDCDKISYEIYSNIEGRLVYEESYMLNLFGDHQKSSVSYIKFRDLLTKYAQKENSINLYNFTDEENNILKRFNLLRNWNNHIPESLLTADLEMIKSGMSSVYLRNPIQVPIYNYVQYKYLESLFISSSSLHTDAKKMLQCAKKDYSLLINEHVRVYKISIDEPRDMKDCLAVNMSAKIQGL